ncbi:hypothetical protein [Streptomyces noursei]|uniref:hypothetical protein n=1 Tax=Streptomyces noursei TaxID=1971 RepID=UPI00045EFDCA|nr:hypothetical protein [Streptomyces noursei]AIA06710.1 hypothetical protein DC74_6271 [Streptomyces noursei]
MIAPHLSNQAALGTLRSTAPPAVQRRFAQWFTEDTTVGRDEHTEEPLRRASRMIRHPSAPTHP